MVPLFLFGVGPFELALVLAILALLFGPPVVKRLGKRVGRVVGGAERSVEEFEAGREDG